MYLRFATIFALLSAPLVALAQSSNGPNAFKVPAGGYSATVGQPLDLEWTPTTSGTVSLLLRSGESTDLKKGVTIASSIANSGSYTWIPTNNFPNGNDYAIEIVDDSDPSQVNYTPQFSLEGSTGIPSTVSSSATGSSATGTSGTATNKTAGSSSGAPTKTRHHGATTVTSGTMMTVTSGSSSVVSQTAATGVSSGTGSGASFQPTSASSSQGSAARATAMAGMLGAVALGAFAL